MILRRRVSNERDNTYRWRIFKGLMSMSFKGNSRHPITGRRGSRRISPTQRDRRRPSNRGYCQTKRRNNNRRKGFRSTYPQGRQMRRERYVRCPRRCLMFQITLRQDMTNGRVPWPRRYGRSPRSNRCVIISTHSTVRRMMRSKCPPIRGCRMSFRKTFYPWNQFPMRLHNRRSAYYNSRRLYPPNNLIMLYSDVPRCFRLYPLGGQLREWDFLPGR